MTREGAASGVMEFGGTFVEDTRSAFVRVDGLRNFKPFVRSFGGNPDLLLRRAMIAPATLDKPDAVVPYRLMIQLLERAAEELDCPDFGMRLAATQGGEKVLGPLRFAMRNASTLGDAYRFCANYVQAYTPGAKISLERDYASGQSFLRFEILLPEMADKCQAVEHALLLTQHAAMSISSKSARAKEIWFTHGPLAPVKTYQGMFDALVRFDQPANGLVFQNEALACPPPNPDPELYRIISSFIGDHYPSQPIHMITRVRSIVARMLSEPDCTAQCVASALGVHPRTLQRCLHKEGESFESIKDGVRRENALRYLKRPDIPLVRVAHLLGYSESSVLSRNCHRWFSKSPGKLRHHLMTQ